RREIERIDEYFAKYEAELRSRKRTKKEQALHLEERLAAARQEHQRRREDQVQRHEILVLPQIDSIVLLAEPCWKTAIRTAQGTCEASFLPRSRQWRPMMTDPA